MPRKAPDCRSNLSIADKIKVLKITQQCESLVLDEGESLVSDDEVELIEILVEEEEETVEAPRAPIENFKSTSVAKLKQRKISQFFSKSDP